MLKRHVFVRAIAPILPMTILLLAVVAAPEVRPEQASVSPPPTRVQPCPTSEATDAAIVKAIQDKIKADSRFDKQRDHINVMSRNRVVKLEGWVRGVAQKNAITEFARTTDCVIRGRIRNLLRTRQQGNCARSQQPCCGGCIERTSVCNCMN